MVDPLIHPRPEIDYSFLKGVSCDYCLPWKSMKKNYDYIPFLNLLREYKINMTRIFAYCGWDTGVFPWEGRSYDRVRPDWLNRLRSFIRDANERGIVVILSLFQDNAGGGTEDITSADKGQLAEYIRQVVEATKESEIIYETANEIADTGFQGFVLNELRKHGARLTCSYYHDIGATYRSIHTEQKTYCGEQAIHSNDVYPVYETITDEDYKRISQQAKEGKGHFEYLFFLVETGES